MTRSQAEFDRLRIIYAERVSEQEQTHPGYTAAWNRFVDFALTHGGELVVPPLRPDPLLGMIESRGSLVPEETRIVVAFGAASDCHANAATLWRERSAIAIGTSYALSDDDLWREHSWAWDDAGALIETTERRDRYLGIRFDDEEAQWFADWMSPHE